MSRADPNDAKWANLKEVSKGFQEIPKPRRRKKLQKTAFGLGLVALGISGQLWLAWPWWAGLGTVMIGAHAISGELVETGGKWLVGMAKDLVPFLRKNGGK